MRRGARSWWPLLLVLRYVLFMGNTNLSFTPTLFMVGFLYLGVRLCRSFVFYFGYECKLTSTTLSPNPTIHNRIVLLMSLAFATVTKLFMIVTMCRWARSWWPFLLVLGYVVFMGEYESVAHSYSFYGRFSISRCSALPLIGILVWVRM